MRLTCTTTAAATGVVVARSVGAICRGSEPAEQERAFSAAWTRAAAANVGVVPPSSVSSAIIGQDSMMGMPENPSASWSEQRAGAVQMELIAWNFKTAVLSKCQGISPQHRPAQLFTLLLPLAVNGGSCSAVVHWYVAICFKQHRRSDLH